MSMNLSIFSLNDPNENQLQLCVPTQWIDVALPSDDPFMKAGIFDYCYFIDWFS